MCCIDPFIKNSNLKIEEITQMREDEENLMNATDSGIIYLDSELNIRRFSKVISSIFNFLPHDVGRPIDHVAYNLNIKNLSEEVKNVQKSSKKKEIEFKSNHGKQYLLKIFPFRRSDDSIDGVILSITDVNKIYERRGLCEKIFELAPNGLIAIDENGIIIQTNRSSV